MSPVVAPSLPRFEDGAHYMVSGSTLKAICRNIEARTLLQGARTLFSHEQKGVRIGVGNRIIVTTEGASPLPPPISPSGSGSEPHVPSGSPGSGNPGSGSGSGSNGGTSGSGSGSGSGSPSSSHSVSYSTSVDKAIVPVAGEWIGWMCEEQPSGTFEHVMTLHSGCCSCKNDTLADLHHVCAPLPPELLQGAEAGSLVAVAADANGAAVCARVESARVVAEVAGRFRSVIVTVQGARRGHAARWQRMSRAAAAAYEEHHRRALGQ